MDDLSSTNSNVGDPELMRFHEGGTSPDSRDMGDIGSAFEVLTKADLELAYCLEKLMNLESLLLHVLTWENDFEAMAAENVSADYIEIEEALKFDLLSGFLVSEVKELDSVMGSVRVALANARQKMSLCRHLGELFIIVEGKLHDSEESLMHSQERVLETKMQLAKSRMKSLSFNRNDWIYNRNQEQLEDIVSNFGAKPRNRAFEERHILRMLEKSLASELDLEKKLTESKQNEEDLKLKLRLTEQVAFCMEEAAEVIWSRFLEAENAAEVLMGISKELVGRHQVVQFNLNGFFQREEDLKSKLQQCTALLREKEISVHNLNSRVEQLMTDYSEVPALRENIKVLEEQLKESQSHFKKVNKSYIETQEQLQQAESTIDSLKESMYTAENRAETAEEKIVQLTETNMELTEEIGFLKGNNDGNTQKMSQLEKHNRDLELHLQHAKASSEAGQEQQNMLYSAIWDMETLIDELKQKVLKAEIKIENSEEQCVVLSDTNLELNKEIEFLRARIEKLETSLNQANVEKIASAKDISIKTNVIMEIVVQLAAERERVQRQLYSLTEEKRSLMEKLQKTNSVATNATTHVVSSANASTESLSKGIQAGSSIQP